MHVAINGMFWGQPTVGSGQYLHGLLGALTRVAPQHRYTLLLPAYLNDEGRMAVGSSFVVHRSSFVQTPFDGRNANLAKLWFEQIGVPVAAARLGADLLHVPYFAPPLCSRVPVVATILDIIPLLLPEYRGSAVVRAYMRLIALAARRVRHAIAISEHSRRDIITHLRLPPEHVTTVPLAAGPQYQPANREQAAACVAERYGLHEPFVYYVGGLDARKNVATLVRAFARMRRAGGPPATLAIAGRALGGDTRLFPDLDALIADECAEGFVRRIDVPHSDGPLLYQAATVFAYPSRYEGFGLPPLEALACGAPTVVADTSSLPEAVGGAALRVPPDDISGWTAALWRLLADDALRAELRARGLQHAARFSYERAACSTLDVFQANRYPRP